MSTNRKDRPGYFYSFAKYKAKRTAVDGIMFASKKEAARYVSLKAAVNAGLICDLECQVRFPLKVQNERIGHYVADFTYTRDGAYVVEDVKGFRTPLYRWKAKHFKAQYGFAIEET